MSVEVVSTRKCDRCGDEIIYSYPVRTIGHLSYMVLTNGSGSSRSDMDLDLCKDCTTVFLSFMNMNKRQ